MNATYAPERTFRRSTAPSGRKKKSIPNMFRKMGEIGPLTTPRQSRSHA
jgi:hypothetical protein